MYKKILAIALLSLLAGSAGSKQLLTEFSGHGPTNTTTREFRVEAPWLVDWRVHSDFIESMAFEIALIDTATNTHQGFIVRAKRPDNGVRLFNQGGSYRLRISSAFTRWHLKVEQLTREEAELYTPREEPSLVP